MLGGTLPRIRKGLGNVFIGAAIKAGGDHCSDVINPWKRRWCSSFQWSGQMLMRLSNSSAAVLIVFSRLRLQVQSCEVGMQLTLHLIHSVTVSVLWVIVASSHSLRLFRPCFAPVC